MKRKTIVLLISFSVAVVACLAVIAFINTRQNKQLAYYAKASAQQAFTELVSDMDDLSFDLEKSIYISDTTLQNALCTQIYGETIKAQTSLGMLPYESWQIEQAAGFVAKLGDYVCALGKSVYENNGYSAEEFENLQSLSGTAVVLADNLRELQMQIANGTMVMDTALLDQKKDANTILLSDAISDIESEFPELPTLIYDGPFSDARSDNKSNLLADAEEVSQSRGRELTAEFLGTGVGNVEIAGECSSEVPLWCCKASISGSAYYTSITKSGGYIWTAYCERSPEDAQYSVLEAKQIAGKILESQNIENMEASYYIVQDNIAYFNFEYVQDNVICYADLIKVGIALDNGALQSYDASGYIENHSKRELNEPKISEEEAIATIPQHLYIDEVKNAMIPKDSGSEILCYEILCHSEDERECLIYVNAENGKQEKILILLRDENGTLTI